MALPFVPNISPIDPEDLLSELQEMTARAARAEAAEEELSKQVVELESTIKAFTSDVVIVFDATGSMQGSINGISAEIPGLAKVLSQISEDTRVGLVEFKDKCRVTNRLRVFPLTKVDASGIAQIQSFAASTNTAGCNTNVGEDVYAGFNEAVKMDWQALPESQVILIIGDDAPHPETQTALLSGIQNWAQDGRSVSTRYMGAGSATEAYFRNMAKVGNGVDTYSSDGPFSTSLLLALTK